MRLKGFGVLICVDGYLANAGKDFVSANDLAIVGKLINPLCKPINKNPISRRAYSLDVSVSTLPDALTEYIRLSKPVWAGHWRVRSLFINSTKRSAW
jgi:hypothetical protein